MNFILSRRLKFYTKEIFKLFKFILLAFVIVVAVITVKYKPVYGVKLSGEQIGYVEDVDKFNQEITDNIKNYKTKNVCDVSIQEEPQYEFKFVSRTEETNESDILIAMQQDMIIKYKYFDICINNEKIDSVDTLEQAEAIVNELKEKDSEIQLQIIEQITENVEDIKTNTLEVAKENVFQKFNIIEEQKEEERKSTINGVRLAAIPVQGNITSRYGVSSRIRVSTHTGLDIGAVTGTPIKAVASGTVTCAAYSGAYGNLVRIDHGNGVETWYGHTSKMYVSQGQKVNVGDTIAAVGSTGNSTGPHLHFEIRVNGEHVNPQNYLNF